jgi:hypothetical protein
VNLYGRSECGTGNQGTLEQAVIDDIDERNQNDFTHVKVRRHRPVETGRGHQEARSHVKMPASRILPRPCGRLPQPQPLAKRLHERPGPGKL